MKLNNHASGRHFLCRCLNESIEMLLEEGLTHVFARHQRWAKGVRAAGAGPGPGNPMCRPGRLLTDPHGVVMPAGADADRVRRVIFERFDLSLGMALGKVKGRMLRIGHLGDSNDLTLLAALVGCEIGLKRSGVALASSGVLAAMDYCAAHPQRDALQAVA